MNDRKEGAGRGREHIGGRGLMTAKTKKKAVLNGITVFLSGGKTEKIEKIKKSKKNIKSKNKENRTTGGRGAAAP